MYIFQGVQIIIKYIRGEVMVLGLGGQNILSQIIEGAKHTILPLCPLNFLNIEGAAAPSAPPITTPLVCIQIIFNVPKDKFVFEAIVSIFSSKKIQKIYLSFIMSAKRLEHFVLKWTYCFPLQAFILNTIVLFIFTAILAPC